MNSSPKACLPLLALAALSGATVSIRLVDIAANSGLTLTNTFGGKEKKTYILESTGNGIAIFDYDGDGANDILIANGTTLEKRAAGAGHTLQLYHNDGRVSLQIFRTRQPSWVKVGRKEFVLAITIMTAGRHSW